MEDNEDKAASSLSSSIDSNLSSGDSSGPSDPAVYGSPLSDSDPLQDSLRSRKTYECVVPTPISTSTRSFASSRRDSISIGSTSPVSKKTSSPLPSTPKKWVVNVPSPLAGFSSSPSPQSRLSTRLSMRFDLSSTPPLQSFMLEPSDLSSLDETSKSPTPERSRSATTPTTLEPDSISVTYANDSEYSPPRVHKRQDRSLAELEPDFSPLIARDTSSTSMTYDRSVDDTLTLDALVSPRYKPPVPQKSAALLERRRERSSTILPHDALSRAAPPPVPKRKSAIFDRSSIRLASNSSAEPVSEPQNSEERAKTRANIASEFLKTENFYVKSLRTIVHSYLLPMRLSLASDMPLMSSEHVKALFSNVEVLLSMHTSFEAQIDAIVASWSPDSKLGLLVTDFVPMLRIYTQYINNYNRSLEVYQEHMKHKAFRRFMADAAVGNDLDNWPSYCIQPVQRIPKYMLILGELLKNTPEQHEDYQDLKNALGALSSMAEEINAQKRDAENLTHCAQVQSMLSYPEGIPKYELVNQRRRFCREGQAEVFINGIASPYNYLILFTDLLLITKYKKKHFRFDGILMLPNTLVYSPNDAPVPRHPLSASTSSSNLFGIESSIMEEDEEEEHQETPDTPHKRSASGPVPSYSSLISKSPPSSPIDSIQQPSHIPTYSQSNGSTFNRRSSQGHSALAASAPVSPSSSASLINDTHLIFKSLVLKAVIEVHFSSAEECQAWKHDAMAKAAKPDEPVADSFVDRVLTVEHMLAAATDDSITSPRKGGSLGSSSRQRIKRLLTLGSRSKKDSLASAPTELPSPTSGDTSIAAHSPPKHASSAPLHSATSPNLLHKEVH